MFRVLEKLLKEHKLYKVPSGLLPYYIYLSSLVTHEGRVAFVYVQQSATIFDIKKIYSKELPKLRARGIVPVIDDEKIKKILNEKDLEPLTESEWRSILNGYNARKA